MQLPQRPLPSHGSPSGSNQSPVAAAAAACFAQPKLEPSAQISMPSKAKVVYPVTGKAVPGVIFQPSGKTNIVQSTGKDTCTGIIYYYYRSYMCKALRGKVLLL